MPWIKYNDHEKRFVLGLIRHAKWRDERKSVAKTMIMMAERRRSNWMINAGI